MKKAVVLFMVLALSVSTAACGNKEKNKSENDAKVEQSQNGKSSDNSKKNNSEDKEQKIYELSSEDSVWTIKVSAPEGCSEADFSSETARAFESIGSEEGSSLQYVMTLRNADVATVEGDMKEEVQYLFTANSEGTVPAMNTETSEYNGKTWNYFSYNMEGLTGYRVWVELSDGDIFACTVEWIGDGETPDDIDTVVQTLSSCIADYDV